MGNDLFTISDRIIKEKLVPVISYVNYQPPEAISAWLSFLTVCHEDLSRRVHLSNILTHENEAICESLLAEIIKNYLINAPLPLSRQNNLLAVVYNIIKKLSEEARAFLLSRLRHICGEDGFENYWNLFEKSSCLEEVTKHLDMSEDYKFTKHLIDFSKFFIAFIIIYDSESTTRQQMILLDKQLVNKFSGISPNDQLGICLLPLDFSFVYQREHIHENDNEHSAILKSARIINPNFQVQVCTDSLLWVRDIIAWVDDECSAFVRPYSGDSHNTYGVGLLNEGGNAVTGTSVDKFLLIAQGAFPDILTEVGFRKEMYKRNIIVYTLPDGFLWARNPVTQKDVLLDSIHIDSSINVIPAGCTTDGHPKILIDPRYYAMVNNNEMFQKFIKEQVFTGEHIVLVDKCELYLNLPNFSIFLDTNRYARLFFNKDKGFTLPRLKLKPDIVIQPEIEITKLPSSFGCIRCVTTMLPESFVNKPQPPTVSVSEDFSPEVKNNLLDLFCNNSALGEQLSKRWISHLEIKPVRQNQPWNLDEITRTAVIFLTPDQTFNVHECNQDIIRDIATMYETLGLRLGIED